MQNECMQNQKAARQQRRNSTAGSTLEAGRFHF
jgi:hypothetical protein